MQKYHPLESPAWAANALRQVRLDLLPPGKRVRELVLFFDLSGTKDAADTLDGQQFALSVANLRLGKFLNISGWNLQQLMHQVYGRVVQDPTDIPGAGLVFDMEFQLRIPFRNPRQPASDDGSIPTELLHGKSLEISFAAANVWGVGNLLVTAGTVRAQAELVDETNVPQLMEIGFFDPGAQTSQLEPGVYTDLFLVDGTGAGSVTRAEVTTVSLDVDGQPVWNGARHEEIVAAYNGSGVRDSAAEVTDNAATRLPLIWQDAFGKGNITKQPAVVHGGRLQITGTMATPRFVYWRALTKDKEAVERIGVAIGAPSSHTQYEPATASKRPLRAFERARAGYTPRKASIATGVLPGKVRLPGTLNQ